MEHSSADWRPGADGIPLGATVVAEFEGDDGDRWWQVLTCLPDGYRSSAPLHWWPDLPGKCRRWLRLDTLPEPHEI